MIHIDQARERIKTKLEKRRAAFRAEGVRLREEAQKEAGRYIEGLIDEDPWDNGISTLGVDKERKKSVRLSNGAVTNRLAHMICEEINSRGYVSWAKLAADVHTDAYVVEVQDPMLTGNGSKIYGEGT